MPISGSLEAKTKVDLTLEATRGILDMTWDEATMTWDEQTGTWDNPKGSLTKESKTKVSLTLENKV